MFRKNEILTVPNLLSLVRLLLIPAIVWLYTVQQDARMSLAVLLFSGATDIADGMIARRWNMVSDFGKILDPVADKLTQFAVMLCLVGRFPRMIIPAGVFFVKESAGSILGILAVKQSHQVLSADWHGKLTTVLLYTTMVAHMIWPGLSDILSGGLIAASIAMMLFSAAEYAARNRNLIRGPGDR